MNTLLHPECSGGNSEQIKNKIKEVKNKIKVNRRKCKTSRKNENKIMHYNYVI
jgi:hypothetical protein